MNRGTCIHFNGIQNKACERGIAYGVNWPAGPKPCIKFIEKTANGSTYIKPGEKAAERKPFPGADKAKPCPFWQAPTDAEVEKDRQEMEAVFDRVKAGLRIASEWRVKPKPAADRHEVVECPCCKGRLHLSQSAYNGHVHGRCETDDCINWME